MTVLSSTEDVSKRSKSNYYAANLLNLPQQTVVRLVPNQAPDHVAHHPESPPASRTSRHTSDDSLSTTLLAPARVTVIRYMNN